MRKLICVTLALLLLAITLAQTFTGTYAAGGNLKGVMIDYRYAVEGQPGAPSFAALRAAHFSIVGTEAFSTFTVKEWASFASWVRSAQSNGFTTFVILSGDGIPFSSVISTAESAARLNVDILVLDEMISTYGLTKQQLLTGINAILNLRISWPIILDEYVSTDVQDAYAWTASYSNVRIATDDYSSQSTIALGISLASKYNKKAMAWIDFVLTSPEQPCYANLSAWLAYVSGKPVDVLFYYVNADGGWTVNWSKVVSF